MADNAAIVGAGLIGRAWAMVFARARWKVRVYDSHPAQLSAARTHVATDLVEQQAAGLVDDAAAAAARVSYHEGLSSALEGAVWVQESLPEDVDLKRAVFAQLDALAAPGTILASSTSAIPASRFTEGLPGRARCLVAHPVNPPHLVPVVELCGAPWTTPATLERASAVMRALGQVPVLVRRELDGFILNRLQGALLSEAMRLVVEGYVSPEDLDKTVKDGLGLRWSFMGPFATIELNAPGGVADYCARYSGFYRRLAADPPSPTVWDEENARKVVAALDAMPAGVSPAPTAALQASASAAATTARALRMAWRDAQLLALRRHKRGQDI